MIESSIFDRIKQYVEDGNNDAISTSVSSDEIHDAEVKIGANFNPTYRDLISIYGAMDINGQYVYGLRYVPLMGRTSFSVVDKTLFYKNTQKWPGIDDWYIISDDGRGNPIGCKPDGSVWLSDHDAGFEQIKLADSFEDFLHKLLTDTLYQ